MNRKMKRKSFTLMELLVVILIIGLLGGLVGPKVFSQIGKSKWNVAAQQTRLLRDSVNQYYMDKSKYPDSLEDLLGKDSFGESYFSEEYIPKDPWGNNYIYQKPGTGDRKFDIICYGEDGTSGGEGANKDVSCFDDLSKKED